MNYDDLNLLLKKQVENLDTSGICIIANTKEDYAICSML